MWTLAFLKNFSINDLYQKGDLFYFEKIKNQFSYYLKDKTYHERQKN
jgi:hypothetical protein